MIATTALVLAGVLVIVVAQRYQLTAPQVVGLATGLFVMRAGGVWVGRYILGAHGRAAADSGLPARDARVAGDHHSGMLGWTTNREHALIMATGLLTATSVVLGLVVYVRRSGPASM